MLQIEFDYNSMMRMLRRMKFDNEVLICQGDAIVLSNGPFSGVGKKFDMISVQQKMGYKQTITLHGAKLDIYVLKADNRVRSKIVRFLPILGFLVIINVVLPMGFVLLLNHSFTKRIRGLSKVFQSVNGEHLVQMAHEDGRDEIGSMIRNYNRMVKRTNELIQTVYKNKIKEQEILVGRKNAELLALQSQINPHFLFNALESIRMRSLLKEENETADMVEKLAIMQRQYVDWGNDSVEIEQELEFVKAYLSLQKYRFGDRLNYNLEIDPECAQIRIPKLTIVTFVENACVHGIESKASPGWIFVRAYKREEQLYIEIEDTGSGIEEQKLYQMQHDMQNADIEMLKTRKAWECSMHACGLKCTQKIMCALKLKAKRVWEHGLRSAFRWSIYHLLKAVLMDRCAKGERNMLKVLLVDDEPFIIQGLKVLIDWEQEGYMIAGTASNGKEAYDFLKKRV